MELIMKSRLSSLAALALAAGLAAPALAGDPDEILAAEGLEFEEPDLLVGDPAPDLSVTNWVKGEEVTSFQPGHTYVVEFWATWCGPCIRGMPHLTELQEQYEGDATIIGVNIWERDEGDTRIERVTNWVGEREDMGYTVAIDGTKAMEEEWMKAAGQDGIPSAFIVDGTGTIAWIGHPGSMDKPLEAISAGEFDLEEAAESYVTQMRSQAWLQHLFGLFQAKEWDHAYEVAGALLERDFSEQPEVLNQVSWIVLTHPMIEERDIAFAIKAAERGVELTEREDSNVLDTLARGYFMNGEVEKAIETQEEAIEVAPEGEQREALRPALEEYRAALDPK